MGKVNPRQSNGNARRKAAQRDDEAAREAKQRRANILLSGSRGGVFVPCRFRPRV